MQILALVSLRVAPPKHCYSIGIFVATSNALSLGVPITNLFENFFCRDHCLKGEAPLEHAPRSFHTTASTHFEA